MNLSSEAALALDYINHTRQSIFITGKAGTGKTTLLKQLLSNTYKNAVVVAPTGIAALNAGGVTIHSMFNLPFAGFIPRAIPQVPISDYITLETKSSLVKHFNISATKRAVLNQMELLIIDEVSMLRPDILDAIDFMLQRIRGINKPYGGVQVVFIGDLLQLPPIIKPQEWAELSKYYSGKFFFNAEIIHSHPPILIELTKIYRQEDNDFISILNNLRNNSLQITDVDKLNTYYKPDFDTKNNFGYITLTTHNNVADRINHETLAQLNEPTISFEAEIIDDFPEKIYPIDYKLDLKLGAQVMFIKNDISHEKRYYNGKIGKIVSLHKEDGIKVYFEEEDKTIYVDKYEWEHKKYSIQSDTNKIIEEILGTFTQYPLKLAWAITVHKSQGLTFEKAILDIANVFESGQAYVAFSRLTSLKHLVLKSKISINGIDNQKDVIDYSNQKLNETTLKQTLISKSKLFLLEELKKGFDFELIKKAWITHLKENNNEASEWKQEQKSWATLLQSQCVELDKVSEKFQHQLDLLFSPNDWDKSKVSERVLAAFDYFKTALDEVFLAIVLQVETVKQIKRAKTYFLQLRDLENAFGLTMSQLYKCKQLAIAIAQMNSFSKETINIMEYSSYYTELISRAKEHYRMSHNNNLLEEENTSYYSDTNIPKAKDKKTTYEKTHELWLENPNIGIIASSRKLSLPTIETHLCQLIKEKKIAIEQLVANDTLKEMRAIFEFIDKNTTISQMRDLCQEKFQWGELKFFKESIS